MSDMESTYNPKLFESKWYQYWMQHRLFEANPKSGKKPYVIMMPPPNVTSQLHMGHGTGYTMQDIMIRWKRMQGFDALWLPGTDHAGIATQMMVEKDLMAKEGLTRQQLGREKFLSLLQAWKEKYGGQILEQFKAMGFSCDWSRLAYTMDENLSQAVREIFVRLYNDGLIYRGERLVNWDPVLKTAISDDEVYSEEITGALYYIKYPLEDGSAELLVATTRPETMLGDVALAVHPEDDRYKHLIGKRVQLPLCNRMIPIIGDEYVKMDFGTGCLKITPAHDPNDFIVGKRHGLPMINVMNDDGTMTNDVPEAFRGLDRFKARAAIVKALKEAGLFDRDEKHKHAVPHSDRSKAIIEPRLSWQWYVSMKKLAEPALQAAKTGDLNFFPDNWKKTYLYWLENIQDWCISRQLWWGHRIPIWHCSDCKAYTTADANNVLQDPSVCKSCGSNNIKQDEDVLDTWFSSWLWPVSTLGWPDEKSEDLKHYFPGDVLITAPEIIFLWVARMVMVGYYTQGKSPFKDVFLTATVCDEKGRKFSKTLGNGIDPVDVIEEHGTDAVRFTGVHLAPLGGRIRMARSDFEVGGKFINKIWNAARFILGKMNEHDRKLVALPPIETLPLYQRWLLTELKNTAKEVCDKLEQYRINDAVHSLYHFIWGSLCDWGIELAKDDLNQNEAAKAKTRQETFSVFIYLFDQAMRLASPILPFVSEEIWQKLPAHPDLDRPVSLCVAKFPDAEQISSQEHAHKDWQKVAALISSVRSVRTTAGIPPKALVMAHVYCEATEAKLFEEQRVFITRLAKISDLVIGPAGNPPPRSLVAVGAGFQCYVPAEGFMDIEAEIKRLQAEQQRLGKIVAGIKAKLDNSQFMANAPDDIKQQTKSQFENLSEQLSHVMSNLKSLS